MSKDFLDEIVENRKRTNRDFPQMVEANLRARRLLRSLAERRRKLGLSQTAVAGRMGTSQSALARLEGGESDPRVSTVERYALAMGQELAHRRVMPARASTAARKARQPATRKRS
jgi:transcriptional regulator with XRE-family HTH domain